MWVVLGHEQLLSRHPGGQAPHSMLQPLTTPTQETARAENGGIQSLGGSWDKLFLFSVQSSSEQFPGTGRQSPTSPLCPMMTSVDTDLGVSVRVC